MPNAPEATLLTAPRSLLYLAAAVLLVAVLSVAETILVPLALAAMLGFVLMPLVAALERRGIHRLPSVAVVLSIVLAVVALFGYVLAYEFNDLARHMPRYSVSIKAKLATLRETRKGAFGTIESTLERVTHDLDEQDLADRRRETGQPPPAPLRNDAQPVVVVANQPSDLQSLHDILEPVLKPFATAGIVLILVGFILVQREDIRNRLIRLVGQGRITVTTRTLDEAGARISGFLFTQFVINAAFGVCVTIGLLVIGVPYALLWGASAALLRFVPYLGSLLAMLMPVALAIVSSVHWTPTIATVILFLALDGLTAYLVEPVLIGSRTGVSSLALLVSAMFWTWLWGPLGLLLSTPITVCLAVVGKHVPEMEFLAVLLGDDAPLTPEITFYQRLLAGDDDEASDILDHELAANPPEHVFDRVIVPTLIRAHRDQLRDEISAADRDFVVHTIQDVLRSKAESNAWHAAALHESCAPRRIVAVPARDAADGVAVDLLQQLLGDAAEIDRVSTATLASEVLLTIESSAPDVLCIAALPPGGFRQVRYLCKRVRSQFPDVPVWVLRLGDDSDALEMTQQLDGASAPVTVATSLTEALTQLDHISVPGLARPPSSADVHPLATVHPG
jgi:predicted PurR-regulated permease PerM